MARIRVTTVTTRIGGELHGADLSRPLSTEDFNATHAAWMKHQVLLFRNQQLDNPLPTSPIPRIRPARCTPWYARTR